MLGGADAMLDFLAALDAAYDEERGDDQAALHRLLLSPPPANLSLTVDGRSRYFLSLYACKGPGGARPFPKTGKPLGQLCHYDEHEPLRRISPNGGTNSSVCRSPP